MMEVYLVRMQNGTVGVVLMKEGEWFSNTPIENALLSDQVIECHKCSALAISGSVLKDLSNS